MLSASLPKSRNILFFVVVFVVIAGGWRIVVEVGPEISVMGGWRGCMTFHASDCTRSSPLLSPQS